ncbi:hypothetical protein C1645_811361 [Glomus cerebriforme]|uniref:Uncharacterized protein n=1 Tax=Glomus cerebriforme TaxID=658196 RepID=A0A397TXI7_9GLOM|nr:hypothetical protein C1645_811361 [Glomus cerebriforme]
MSFQISATYKFSVVAAAMAKTLAENLKWCIMLLHDDPVEFYANYFTILLYYLWMKLFMNVDYYFDEYINVKEMQAETGKCVSILRS